MADRQHGRNQNPAGSGRPATSRPGRTVSVSRFPMGSGRPAGSAWTPPRPGTPGYTEPEVRRWPHPMGDAPAAPAPEPALHYIRCALSYQNQLLADIKALLERLEAVETGREGGDQPKPQVL